MAPTLDPLPPPGKGKRREKRKVERREEKSLQREECLDPSGLRKAALPFNPGKLQLPRLLA